MNQNSYLWTFFWESGVKVVPSCIIRVFLHILVYLSTKHKYTQFLMLDVYSLSTMMHKIFNDIIVCILQISIFDLSLVFKTWIQFFCKIHFLFSVFHLVWSTFVHISFSFMFFLTFYNLVLVKIVIEDGLFPP